MIYAPPLRSKRLMNQIRRKLYRFSTTDVLYVAALGYIVGSCIGIQLALA